MSSPPAQNQIPPTETQSPLLKTFWRRFWVSHVLNKIGNSAWHNKPAKIRYSSLATNISKRKKPDNRTSHKNCSATLYYNATKSWQNWMKQTDGLWSRRSIPNNFAWLRVEPNQKIFISWSRSRSLKFGFPSHNPSLWGKRINLLRDGLAVFVHNL